MNKAVLTFLCISFIFLTGCWDSIPIENRAYVIGIAIDEYPPIPEGMESESPNTEQEKTLETDTDLHTGSPMYAMTVQIPIAKIGTLPNIQGGGGGGGEPGTPKTWEMTQVGNSFIEMSRAISTRTNLTPYYEHLQVIVLSDKIAKKGLNDVLDFFIRDHEQRSRTKIFIIDGEAKNILDVTPRVEDYSSIYLAKILGNAPLNAHMIYWTDLGKVVQSIYSGKDFLLPLVENTRDEIMNKGAAVFKGDKMVGKINGQEVEALKMIRNLFKGSLITTKMPDTEESTMALEIDKLKSKITPIIQEDDMVFKINIDIDGDYSESVNCSFQKEIDKSFLEQASKAFEASIKKQCIKTIEKIQDYGADVFEFNTILKAEKPQYWDKVNDDWHDIFPNVKTEVIVNVNLKHAGNIN